MPYALPVIPPVVDETSKVASGVNFEQLGLVAAGGAVVVLALRMMAGLVSRDSEERAELRADAKRAREERLSVATKIGELEAKWQACEHDRSEQDRKIHDLAVELETVKRVQADRLNRESP